MILFNEGRKLIVEGFYLTRTYAGIHHCSDDMLPTVNARILKEAGYPWSLWGNNRKELIIHPKDYSPNKELPPDKISVWLSSSAIAGKSFGSELILTFFAKVSAAQNIREILASVLSDLEWESNAQDYKW